MTNAVIAATGLYTPPNSLSNAELVETFNAYVERFNAANAASPSGRASTAVRAAVGGLAGAAWRSPSTISAPAIRRCRISSRCRCRS